MTRYIVISETPSDSTLYRNCWRDGDFILIEIGFRNLRLIVRMEMEIVIHAHTRHGRYVCIYISC